MPTAEGACHPKRRAHAVGVLARSSIPLDTIDLGETCDIAGSCHAVQQLLFAGCWQERGVQVPFESLLLRNLLLHSQPLPGTRMPHAETPHRIH